MLWLYLDLFLLIFQLSVALANDFSKGNNIDWLFPMDFARIYTTEKRGTYFGYSVASYVGQSQPFCLVGAPKARKTDDFLGADTDHPNQNLNDPTSNMFDNTTGLIYRLNLDTEFPDCIRMPIADNNEERQAYGTLEPGVSLWIGGLVAATSNDRDGLQLGCDPRYLYTPTTSNVSSSLGLGMRNMGTGTCALYTGVKMQYTPIDACVSTEEGACLAGFSGAIEAGDEPGEAYTVVGMPGSYLTEGNVFFGHYRGQKTLKHLRLKSSPQDLKHRGFNLGYAVGLYKHPQWHLSTSATFTPQPRRFTILASSPMWIDNDYRGVVMLLNEALNLDSIRYIKDQWGHIGSFFGYSVAVADLNGDGIAEIIVGSPYFSENQRFEKLQKPPDSIDLQADQAPQADVIDNTHGHYRSLVPDVGRVYIFYGKSREPIGAAAFMHTDNDLFQRTQWEYTHEPPVILNGPRQAGGRFGHVVLTVGDLDGDGIEDMAASCPFCRDARKSPNKGAVYVYLGRKDGRIVDEPDQIIYPGDLPDKDTFACESSFDDIPKRKRLFQAFGWSMTSKSDIDGNLSPDIIIGDYESEQVVSYQSRNFVWLEQHKWNLPSRPTLEWFGPNNTSCGAYCRYKVALTLRVNAREAYFSSKMNITLRFRYRIDLDSRISQDNLKRLQCQQTGQSVVYNNIELPIATLKNDLTGNRVFQLFELTVEPRQQQTSNQLWKPIVINASIELLSESRDFLLDQKSQIPGWGLHPKKGDRTFMSQPMYFSNTECGYDDICVPDLHVEVYDTSEGFDFGAEGASNIYYKERVSERNLTIAVRNLGENAYETKIRVQIPNQFSYVPDKNYLCKIEAVSNEDEGALEEVITLNKTEIYVTTVVCSLANPFISMSSRWEKIRFQLSTSGVFDPPMGPQSKTTKSSISVPSYPNQRSDWQPPERLEILVEVTSDNENMRDLKVNAKFSYELKLLADVKISSSSIGHTVFDRRNFSSQFTERQRLHPENIGPEYEQIFLVSNLGPSPMENIWVNLSVPLQTEGGEFLVYLLDFIRTQHTEGAHPLQLSATPQVVSADGQSRGLCTTPESAINPLRLNAVELKRHQAQGRSPPLPSRRRRDVERDSAAPGFEPSVREGRSTAADLLGERMPQQRVISCDRPLENLGVPICIHISCNIERLGRGDTVRVVFRGWVWADTLFRHKFSDIAIVSTALVVTPARAFGIPVSGNFSAHYLTVSQNFVFEGIKMLSTQTIPILPVIIGVVLGILLLIVIIIVMWRCGFFKRARLTDEDNASADGDGREGDIKQL